MIRNAIIAAAIVFASPVAAQTATPSATPKIDQARGLTVGEAVALAGALGQLNCAYKIIKDGAKESDVCVPYDWHALYGDDRAVKLPWTIATYARAVAPIADTYRQQTNEALAALPRKADGTPSDAAQAQFQIDDQARLKQPANIELGHFKRADIEPLNLQPSLISALLPIIDDK